MSNETYHQRHELVDGYRAREHPVYMVWADMKSRCRNEKQPGYENYGGRGITYCERWKHFANFAADVGMPPFPGASIDRIDTNGNYEPGNIQWADRQQQARNRRKFRSNRSGETGVVPLRNGRFLARYDDHGERYHLGRFASVVEAKEYRDRFIATLPVDREAALAMCERRARHDSSTGMRGVTRHEKNGNVHFVARRTVNGSREYVGRFNSISAAAAALEKLQ